MAFPDNVFALALLGAGLTTAVSVPFWRRWCRRAGAMDDPGQRKLHSAPVPLAGGLKQIERAVIAAVLERCRGNKAAAARVLGLHRRTLYRLLEADASANEQGMPLPLVLDPGAADSASGAFCS